MIILSNVRVKICGIKDHHTALAAIELGADALGFVFAPSPRQVDTQLARDICTQLPPFVAKVGVFVDTPVYEVERIAMFCRLDVVQLHGNEPPQYAAELDIPVIKAVRVKDVQVLRQAAGYPASALLLDTYTSGVAGGTGKTFNWHLLQQVNVTCPVILAGGLTPDNVAQAVDTVKPYGVDVSTGVETNGIKDIQKIELFIRRAKGRG